MSSVREILQSHWSWNSNINIFSQNTYRSLWLHLAHLPGTWMAPHKQYVDMFCHSKRAKFQFWVNRPFTWLFKKKRLMKKLITWRRLSWKEFQCIFSPNYFLFSNEKTLSLKLAFTLLWDVLFFLHLSSLMRKKNNKREQRPATKRNNHSWRWHNERRKSGSDIVYVASTLTDGVCE